MRQFVHTVARNSAFGMGAQAAIKLLSFCFTVLIVRHLGTEAYGQYAGVLAFGAIFVFLGDLGLSPYMVREVARKRDTAEGLEEIQSLLGNVIVLRLILSGIAIILLLAVAWLTQRPVVMIGAIALSSLGLLIHAVQGAGAAVLSGFERVDIPARAQVVSQLVFVALGGAALWLGGGYYGLILANLIAIGVLTVVCWRQVRALKLKPLRALAATWPGLLRASLPFGLIGFALGFSYKFDTILLNIFRGDVETAYYGAAYNLIFSAVAISNVINTALYPSLTRQAATNPGRLPAIYQRVMCYLMVIALPIAIGAWALADQLVPFLFDQAYQPAASALRIVIWVVPLMFATEFLGYIVVIAGEERRIARAVLLSTCCNVGLNCLAVPRFGLVGAAIVTVTTEVILVSQYLWLLRSQVRQLAWNTGLLGPLAAALLMGVAVGNLPGLPLLLRVGVGSTVYLALLLALRVVGSKEFSFIRSLRGDAPVGNSG